VLKLVLALILFVVVLRVGFGLVRAVATPLPPPPPPGELRKVNLHYRCTVCGAQVRMTAAPDELPEPPRHCMEEMQQVAPAIE
jgi:hypothetical protein